MERNRPSSWWKSEYDTGWDNVKEALRRDWEQTKHDFGADAPDLNQDVDDTVKQAAGKEPIPPAGTPNFEENEDAFRYGYGARSHYGEADWSSDLESRLEKDYSGDWTRDRDYVRYSYMNAERHARR